MEPTHQRGGGTGRRGARSPRPLLLRFLEVVDDRVAPTTLSKRTLTDLCHTLEDQVLAEDLEATVIAGFQRARYWEIERERYATLTADPRRSAIVFTADGDGADSPVHHVVVGEEHELAREWFVLALTSGFSAVLFGRELSGAQRAEERDRQFLTIWSFDPTVVSDLADALLTATDGLDPADITALRTALHRVPPRVPEPLMVQRFTNAVFERLEAGQQRLARASDARDVAEQELARRQDRAVELERYATLSTVAAQIAHQMNNPLASITMAAATLPEVEDPGERARLASIIESEALRAGQFAGELQALSAGAPTPLEPVELVGWVQREVGEHRRRGQDIELGDLTGTLSHAVDAGRLSQALSAVLADVRATPERSEPPRVDLENDDAGPAIVVRRDGPATDVTARRMVADPLGTTTLPDGSLVALAMASAHLRHQGGALTISVDGATTSYRLVLPTGEDRAAATPAGGHDTPERGATPTAEQQQAPPAQQQTTGSDDTASGQEDVGQQPVRDDERRALIIDDEPAILGLLEALLRRAGWIVRAACTAEEARQAARDEGFDAVLLDLHLDGGDGLDLLAELDRLRPGTAARTAIVTGDPAAAGSVRDHPVVGKPFVWAELSAALDELAAHAGGPTNGAGS